VWTRQPSSNDRRKSQGIRGRHLQVQFVVLRIATERNAERLHGTGALRAFVAEHYTGSSGDDLPTFWRTAAALDYSRTLALQLLRKTGGGQTLADSDSDEVSKANEIQVADGKPVSATDGPDIVRRLEAVLNYLRLHQRRNPAAFLVEEAIR
jgi:hypothetical protein